ncbi:MAG: Gfo/Idh/MocA family oxidoreductase [Bacteroidota bacterium]
MADAFRDQLDKCYKELTAGDSDEGKTVKDKVDVPDERKFTGFEGYLKAIALADVVILATPPGFRPIHFEECIRQNKHVFMEKPRSYRSRRYKKSIGGCGYRQTKEIECSCRFAAQVPEFLTLNYINAKTRSVI